jgi:hypothetical protein
MDQGYFAEAEAEVEKQIPAKGAEGSVRQK